jgi:thiol-disulfide isomerase/thioredoxin
MKLRFPDPKYLAVLLVAVITLLSLSFTRVNVEEQPVVHVVLFYSTTCGHCHFVMTEVLPPLQEKYGDQLDIQMLELASQQDVDLLYAIATNAGLDKNQVGVPFMVVGNQVLIGSAQIPEELPGLIEMGLSSGGIDFPDIAGLRERISALSNSTEPTGIPVPTSFPIEKVELLYFFSTTCSQCQAIDKDILQPLEDQYGDKLDVQRLDIDTSQSYELFITAEEKFGIQPGERDLPVLILGGNILEGEVSIRQKIASLLDQGFRTGISFPDLPGLESALQQNALVPDPLTGSSAQTCDSGEAEVCAGDLPIWTAYFFQSDCPSCSRIEADIHYIQGKYPQLSVDKFNIYDNALLAVWMAHQLGKDNFQAPALFIGEDLLMGEKEITPDAIETLVSQYQWTGAKQYWADLELPKSQEEIATDFISSGAMNIGLTGFFNGLSPLPFAALILLVSSLSLRGRKPLQILTVVASFSLGVFAACIAGGLGAFQWLDNSADWLTILGRWVYGLMALCCCFVAAVILYRFIRVRSGKISKGLPGLLETGTGEPVDQGRNAPGIAGASFIAGILVFLLAVAYPGHAGQPAINYFSSFPNLQLQQAGLLVLYSLLFVVPVAAVFLLVYYGIASGGSQSSLHWKVARVELGMTVILILLSVWLFISLI